MAYYLAQSGGDEEFFGSPMPAEGVRVVFDPDRLLAARERKYPDLPSMSRSDADDEGLVVYQDPMAVVKLPDRLWRVEELAGGRRLAASNRWVRCKSLTVREELPRWLVMGPHGFAVERVMDQARGLTEESVHAVAAMDPADEEYLVGEVWQRFLQMHPSGSPIGCGLIAVSGCIDEAARRVDPGLFGLDEDDGVEVLMDPTWQQAGHAACAAALALGAPDLLGEAENQRLASRWTTVFGAAVDDG